MFILKCYSHEDQETFETAICVSKSKEKLEERKSEEQTKKRKVKFFYGYEIEEIEEI